MDKETLHKFFSGQATIDQQRLVMDWTEHSPENQKELIRERKLYDSIIMLADMKVLTLHKKTRLIVPRWVKETLRYAAIFAIAIVGVSLYVSKLNQKYLCSYNTISVPAGQHIDVVLSDGTKVCVNALSELRYPAFFSDKERKISLKGEAFFDVAHNADRPFIVETYLCDIEVLGTQFNVQADAEKDEFVTSLLEGKVKVSRNMASNEDVILNPNHQVKYANGRLVVEQIPEYEKFIWREGLIGFNNATFTELVSTFEKYYGVNIIINRRDIPSILFTGKIRINEGIDHALWVLKQSLDFKSTRNSVDNVIYIN